VNACSIKTPKKYNWFIEAVDKFRPDLSIAARACFC
jgi:hypothetical protein